MGDIACIFHRSGAPLPSRDLAALVRAGGAPTWWRSHFDRSFGLAAWSRAAAPAGVEFAEAARPGLVVALVGHLHQRQDLRARLGTDAPAEHESDAAHALAAYLRWGEAAFARLRGDWALVVRDTKQEFTYLARDPMGGRLLYAHCDSELLVAASSIDSILMHALVPQLLDARRAAACLHAEAEWDGSEQTLFRGIHKVPAGHVLAIGRDSTATRVVWRPSIGAPPPSEPAEALWEALVAASADRVPPRGRVGLLLSGGIDSQAVLAALRHVRASGRSFRLGTLSGVGADPRACTEARHIALALAKPVDTSLVQPPSREAWWRGFEAVARHAEDPFVLPSCGLRASLIGTELGAGSDILLTGLGAETILGDGGSALARVAHDQGIRAALAVLSPFAGAWRTERLGLLLSGGLRPYLPLGWRCAWRRFRPRTPQSALSPLLRPEAECDLDAAVHERVEDATMPRSSTGRWRTSQELVALQIKAGIASLAAERYARLGRCFGLYFSHPCMDRRVVDIGLALPLRDRLMGGRSKGVLHAAASPYLARKTVRRVWGPNPDHWTPRLAELAVWLRDLFEEYAGPAADLLNMERCRNWSRDAAAQPAGPRVFCLLPAAALIAATRTRLTPRPAPAVTSDGADWLQTSPHGSTPSRS